MQEKLRTLVDIIRADPAVATVVGFTGGSRAGGGFVSVTLKPASERARKTPGRHRAPAAASCRG
jgi:multidrug efflux pump